MLLIHEKAVEAWLLADTAITSRVGDRVYIDYVPDGASYPYILITLNAQQGENKDALESLNTVINVQVVYTGGNGSLASIIANAAKDRLHNAALTLNGPYTPRRCEFQSAYRMTEIEDGKRFFYAGILVRLEADQVYS